MQLIPCGRNAVARGAAIFALLLGSVPPAGAQEPAGDEDAPRAAGYLLHFFADSDDIQVLSQYGTYDWAIGRGTSLSVQVNHEAVQVPGIDAPVGSPEALDAITTASRPIARQKDAYADYIKIRNELTTAVSGPHYRIGYYVSAESDYFAQQLRTQVDRDFRGRSLNLSAGTSFGWDAIEPLRDEDNATGAADRRTWHGNAVLTQVLDPRTTLRIGGEFTRVRGLQHSPYRNVYAGGTRVAERHPELRDRRDLFLRLNRYFSNRSSLKLLYRLYADDWGVASHTAGLRLAQYVGTHAVVEYRYRYYTQDPSRFFRAEYTTTTGVDGFLSGDYRLGAFDAHLFGGRIDLGLGSLLGGPELLRPLAMSLGYERYFNSNNFSANLFESGLSLAF